MLNNIVIRINRSTTSIVTKTRWASGTTILAGSSLSRKTYSIDAAYRDLRDIMRERGPADDVISKSNLDNNADHRISRSDPILENAAQDASSYTMKRPDLSLVPTCVEQISECVKYCYANDIPMVPVGARTGLEGGIHAMRGGVSFDMSQMKRLLQVNESDLDCHVEAGLSWRELNDQIRSTGLWFPVDPGADASLGGMASTSASGTNAVKYGTMRENVLGLEVVTRDGKVITTAGTKCRSKKSSAGLNLTNLFVGSEGTLGVISSVRLKLHALPSNMAVVTVAFPTVNEAVESVVQVMQCGLPVARIEFLDQPGVSACYQDSKLPNLDPNLPMLFIELHALTKSGLDDQVDILQDIFESQGASNFNWSSKQEERTQLWKARHNLHWSILKTKPGFANIDTDVCVPISRFPEMVAISHELIDKFGLDAPLMGHAGDGNFHSVILYDPKLPGEFEKAKQLGIEMGRVAIKLEGTVTGEHGVGRGKMDLIEEQFDDCTLETMYAIKLALDPKNLFNPDKVFKADNMGV
uniref:D-lactate dehydrogenase (cytochrome) n=1 Tax=Aceria tosichella TaxID=561515 RepID=A0A6G1SH85_9ACAR